MTAAGGTSGVSVIVPHYGDPAAANALIDQLQSQLAAPPLQIVVVDDASPLPFPARRGVELVRRASNGGFGAAVNTGARRAVQPLLCILNSDLTVPSDFIASLVAKAEPWQPAVVSPFIVDEHGAPQWVGRHFPATRHQVIEWLSPLARWRHLPALHEAVGHDTAVRAGVHVPVDWVVGAALLLPTAEFRQVHGFDEGFHMNSEEVDLQRRLRARGAVSVVLGDVTATHAGGGSSDPSQRRRWLVASRLRYARKWRQGPLRLRFALSAASLLNFAVNLPRQLLGRPLDARQVLREELGYLWGRR